jgi:tetratricopeptide (TPR) repeat protein
MTNISLRIYEREIESQIEGRQVEEAIAHSLQILKTFPMCVETYKLLGKAFLEVRHYSDAADIFQRVLMAMPDDFVAHVGIGLIRNYDEGKMDEAIWHMERAFEIQPSNPAIQAELKRLYGRRDGVEPPKVRLTRDALANMYTQGEFYNQAIVEIRSVMAEDANRADLQVMLARAYYRAGQKVEATEMAMTLLKRYPYCLDALRILVDILPGAGRGEDAQVYRQRLEQLDPYAAFAKTSAFASDQVADSAVTLEKLEFQPSGKLTVVEPGWASALGIKLGTGPLSLPVETPPVEPSPRPAVSFEPPASAPAAGESAFPDWLRSAGWQEASGETKEGPSPFAALAPSEPAPAEPIARAEIPDWLHEMAPKEAGAAAPQPGLSNLPEAPALVASPFEGMPGSKEPPAEAGSAASLFAAPPPSAPAGEPPAFDKPLSAGEPLGGQDESFSWLEGLAARQGAKPEELLTRPEERRETPPEWAQPEMPEKRLSALDFEPEMAAPAEASAAPLLEEAHIPRPGAESPGAPVIESGTMAWLDNLTVEGSAAGEPQPPVEVSAVSQEGEVAEWLKRLDSAEKKAEPTPAPAGEELPDWLKGEVPPAAEPRKEEPLPEWLSAPAEAPLASADENIPPAAALTPTAPEEWQPAREGMPSSFTLEGEAGSIQPARKPFSYDVEEPAPPSFAVAAEAESAQPARKPFSVDEEEPSPVAAKAPAPEIPAAPSPAKPAAAPSAQQEAELLLAAQSALKGGRLNEAMDVFAKLIKKGRLLDEIIHTLREASYTYPVDIILWQTLGDAFNRANQLQEAIDAYTKAEELLR